MLKRTAILLAVVFLSCSGQVRTPDSPSPQTRQQPRTGQEHTQIVIYARMAAPAPIPLRWDIRKVSLNRADGSQVDVPGSAVSLRTTELERSQKILTISEINAGAYTGVTIFTGDVYDEQTMRPFPLGTSVSSVDADFSIIAGNAKTLTVVLDLEADSGGQVSEFRPRLVLEPENPRPTGKLVYVANELSSNISIIDKRLKRVVYNVFVGTKPYALGGDLRRNRLYIGDRKDGVIYEMDMVSQQLLRAIELEFIDEPVHLEPIPAKDLLVVVNFGSDTVYLVDSFTLQIIETIEVGDGPVNAVYSPYHDVTFVLNHRFGTISVVNLQTQPARVDTTLRVELNPRGLAVDDTRRWLFVSNSGSTDLLVIKMETLETMAIERSVPIGIGAGDIAFDPFGRRLYVAMTDTREILCVDPFTGVKMFSIKLPAQPGDLLFDPDEKKLYAAIPERNAVVVIDPLARAIQHWIETGQGPSSIAIRL